MKIPSLLGGDDILLDAILDGENLPQLQLVTSPFSFGGWISNPVFFLWNKVLIQIRFELTRGASSIICFIRDANKANA